MKTKHILLTIMLAFTVLALPSKLVAAKPTVPDLTGNWIAALCNPTDAKPLGALVVYLEKGNKRTFFGDFVLGIPGLEAINFDDLKVTIADSRRVNAVTSGTLIANDGEEFQVHLSFMGDLLDTGAIVAKGKLHVASYKKIDASESTVNHYFVYPNLYTGWKPVPPPGGVYPERPDVDTINWAIISYFGGQDMGSYTFRGRDITTYFGGQDMGSYTIMGPYFGGQDMGNYFGGQDMGSYTFRGVDMGTYFGGQDMGTYLTTTYVKRFFMGDSFDVAYSQGGFIKFVILMLPVD